jgi:hypothetical protein
MFVKRFYEVQTESNIATGEEIATLIVNLNRGLILKEIKILNGKICFVLEDKDDTINVLMNEAKKIPHYCECALADGCNPDNDDFSNCPKICPRYTDKESQKQSAGSEKLW